MRVLDVVALITDLPQNNLRRGQVGTIVEELAPDVFEVEFSGADGVPYAMLALQANQLMILYYEPITF
jgi:hypothetical protein